MILAQAPLVELLAELVQEVIQMHGLPAVTKAASGQQPTCFGSPGFRRIVRF